MTQVFRISFSNDALFELLEKSCLKTDKYYLIDINAYRKILFHKLDVEFVEKMIDYYHVSKQFYITRKFTYNSFINVVRQICKHNNIMFTSQIKYNKSKYNIDYLIFHNENAENKGSIA